MNTTPATAKQIDYLLALIYPLDQSPPALPTHRVIRGRPCGEDLLVRLARYAAVERLADLLADVRLEARERDRRCAATCDRTQPPPPLLCQDCPNRIHPDRWQGAIDDDVLALVRGGDYAPARARLIATLGLDQPLKAPAP